MHAKEFLRELNIHLSYLYKFARQMNELDFAASLSGEFRGAQDEGWDTKITAHEVFHELKAQGGEKARSKAEYRIILMLYCQLAEAGGVYEALKNIMGVVTLKPYLLWPFKDLVRVRKNSNRVIGPNANATFRDLAATAKGIGLSRLGSLLENVFRDDIRNGIYHADYVIWEDGLRLRNRNGGYAKKISFDEVGDSVSRAVSFFQILQEYNSNSVRSFDPPKEIVGRFSANPPMPWTVCFDPGSGVFSISGSSPGPVVTPEYERQVAINGRLGGRVIAIYSVSQNLFLDQVEEHIQESGFDPNVIVLEEEKFAGLLADVDKLKLWDARQVQSDSVALLIASPWGFRRISSLSDFDDALPTPLIDITFNDDVRSGDGE